MYAAEETKTTKALRIALCTRETDELQRLRKEVLAHRGPLPPLVVGEYFRVDQKFKDKYQSKISEDSVRIGHSYRFSSSWPVDVIRYQGAFEAVDTGDDGVIVSDIDGGLLYVFEMPTTKLKFVERGIYQETSTLVLELHELHEIRLRRAVPEGDVLRFVHSYPDDDEERGHEDLGSCAPRFSCEYAVGIACRPFKEADEEFEELFEVLSPVEAWEVLHEHDEFGDAFPTDERDADIRAIYRCLVASAHLHHGGATDASDPSTIHKGVAFEWHEDSFNEYHHHHPEARGWSDAETLSSDEDDGGGEDDDGGE